MKGEYMIVGLDPGTTVGLAFLTLEGKAIGVFSSKEMSVDAIVDKILSYGYPAVIATDVDSLPQTVEKVASSFDTNIYVPRTSISLKEKNEIAKTLCKVHNAHERDSLSAAVKAYQHYMNKLENIEVRVRDRGMESHISEIKALVLKGYSLTAAIDMAKPRENAEHTPSMPPVAPAPKRNVAADSSLLKRRISQQKAYILELEKKLKNEKRKKHALKIKLDSYNKEAKIESYRSRELQNKISKISTLKKKLFNLQKRNGTLKRIIKELKGQQTLQLQDKVVVCKILERFTKHAVAHVEELYGIKSGDTLYVKDCSGGATVVVNMLIEKRIKALVVSRGMGHTAKEMLEQSDIALLDMKDIPLVRSEQDYCTLERNAYEREYAAWASRHKRDVSEKKKEWLEGLIDQYRYERKKDAE